MCKLTVHSIICLAHNKHQVLPKGRKWTVTMSTRTFLFVKHCILVVKNSRIFRKDFLHVSAKASATQQLESPDPYERALSPKQENNDPYYVKPCTVQLTMTSMKAVSTSTQRASLSPRKTSEWRAHMQMGTRPPKEEAAQPLTPATLASHSFLFTECYEIQRRHTAPFNPHGHSQS